MKKLFLLLLIFTGFMQAQTLQNPTFGNTTTNSLTVKTNPASTDFDPLLSQDPNTLLTKKRDLKPESSNLDPAYFPIYAWGDSLTNGNTQINYPTQLTDLLGWIVTNKGVGGETSTQIKNRMIADTGNYSKSVIIWSGRNNSDFPTTIKADIATMVAALGHNRYFVMGILNRSDEPINSVGWTKIINLNNDLKAIYGSKYIPIRELVVAAYNPSLPQDVTDHNNDVPPTSLRITSDPIHLNTAGYGVVASELYKRLGLLYDHNGYLQPQHTEWYVKNSPSAIHVTGNETLGGIKTFTNSPIFSSETASTIASFDATKNLKSLSTSTYPSLTELSYVKGVTGSIQTQLNGALLTTTDQAWTGIKSSTNTGATWINGLNLFNNGANWSSQVTNTSTGDGFRFINTSTASGAASTFFNQSNSGGTSAQYVQNNLAGRGINGANYGSGTFLYIDSMTASTGNTLEIRKQGVLVTRFDSNGALRTPVPLFTTTPATASGTSDLLVFTNTSTSLEKIPYTTFAPNLLTGYVSGSGTVSATDNVLQAIQKLNGNNVLKADLSSPTFTGDPKAPTPTAGDNDTSLATTAFVQSATRPYKSYAIRLTQTGTSAPTVSVLENSLGGTVVWTYNSVGAYIGTLVGAFPAAKTTFFLSKNEGTSPTAGDFSLAVNAGDTIQLSTRNTSNVLADGMASNTVIEIRVYP